MNRDNQYLAHARFSRILGSPSFYWDAWRLVLGCESSGMWECRMLWYHALWYPRGEEEEETKTGCATRDSPQSPAKGMSNTFAFEYVVCRKVPECSLSSPLGNQSLVLCFQWGWYSNEPEATKNKWRVSAGPEFSSFLASIFNHCCKSFVWCPWVSRLKVSKFQKVGFSVL